MLYSDLQSSSSLTSFVSFPVFNNLKQYFNDLHRQGFSEPRFLVLVAATFRSPSFGSLKAAATKGRGSLKAYLQRLAPKELNIYCREEVCEESNQV